MCYYVHPRLCLSIPDFVCLSPTLFVYPRLRVSIPDFVCLSPTWCVYPRLRVSIPDFAVLANPNLSLTLCVLCVYA